MEIKNEKYITLAEVKQALEKKEEEGELGYEQKITADYLKKTYKLTSTKATKLVEALKAVEKLNEKQIANIVNLLPQDLDDLRVIFSNERVDLKPEEKQQILDAVKGMT